jgi:hypothetical protein
VLVTREVHELGLPALRHAKEQGALSIDEEDDHHHQRESGEGERAPGGERDTEDASRRREDEATPSAQKHQQGSVTAHTMLGHYAAAVCTRSNHRRCCRSATGILQKFIFVMYVCSLDGLAPRSWMSDCEFLVNGRPTCPLCMYRFGKCAASYRVAVVPLRDICCWPAFDVAIPSLV